MSTRGESESNPIHVECHGKIEGLLSLCILAVVISQVVTACSTSQISNAVSDAHAQKQGALDE